MIRSFINYLKYEKRYSENTVISYQNDLSQFYDFLENNYSINDVNQVTHFILRSWVVFLMKNNMSPRTVNRKISTIRKYFLFLKRENKIETNPTKMIIAPKIGKSLPKFIRKTEIDDLLDNVLKPTDYSDFRDKLIVSLLYNTGMRRAEMINLSDKDIDFINKTILVTGKGKKQRIIPVTDSLLIEIEEFINERNAFFENEVKDFLILSDKGNKIYPKFVYNVVFKNLSMVSSSVKRSPHVLRHSIATHLSDENVEISALKAFLGHSSLSSTQIYTHNSIEKLKKAYVKAHPKAK